MIGTGSPSWRACLALFWGFIALYCPVHLIEMQMLQFEWVTLHPAVISCLLEYAGKTMEELDGCVIVDTLLASEPSLDKFRSTMFSTQNFIDIIY